MISDKEIEKLTSANKMFIDEIKVISWADQEYPSKNVKVLPRDQRDLATLRNREIKSQIEVA